MFGAPLGSFEIWMHMKKLTTKGTATPQPTETGNATAHRQVLCKRYLVKSLWCSVYCHPYIESAVSTAKFQLWRIFASHEKDLITWLSRRRSFESHLWYVSVTFLPESLESTFPTNEFMFFLFSWSLSTDYNSSISRTRWRIWILNDWIEEMIWC